MVMEVEKKLRRPVKGHVQVDQKGRAHALWKTTEGQIVLSSNLNPPSGDSRYKASWEILCERFM